MRGLLRWYRAWSATRLPRCRYVPSCSAYADEAVERFGAARGTWLAVRRVARCRPGGGSGYDPIPIPDLGLPTRSPSQYSHSEENVRIVGEDRGWVQPGRVS